MKEIKFKGWNGKKMTREYTLYEMLSIQLSNNGLKDNWLQYTGLKDINEREIYEGDIIESAWNLKKYRVEWDDNQGGWSFCPDCDGEKKYSEAKVIGNVYKNPELLIKE